MSWYINGTLFTGTIITVGSGKDYENIRLAVEEAPNNSLLLVDPGSWYTGGDDSNLTINKLIYVRGLGASPEDTILRIGYYGIFSLTSGHVYYENLTIRIEDDWQRAFNAVTGGIVTANKVRVLPANVYTYSAGHGNFSQDGIFNFKNCYLTKGHATFVYCNLSLISLDKVEFDVTPDSWSCSGSLSGDYVITPTEDYGYNYGELTITNVDPPFISTWTTPDTITLPLLSGGTYDFTVDWGDTTSSHITAYNQAERTHTYSSSGSYVVTIDGTIEGWVFQAGGGDVSQKITNISQWGCLKLGNIGTNFYQCSNLTITATDILDISGKTTFNNMFYGCSSITTIPNIDLWDTSDVTDMGAMFSHCSNFNQDISMWDVSKVTDMQLMFFDANLFNQNLNSWNTSACTDMFSMFSGATSFNQPLNNWDVSNVTNMSNMFYGATSFNQDISSWLIINFNGGGVAPTLPDMTDMFTGATSFSSDNYSRLLLSWAQQVPLSEEPSITFGAPPTYYNFMALESREYLSTITGDFPVMGAGWTITGDLGYKNTQEMITYDTSDITSSSFTASGAIVSGSQYISESSNITGVSLSSSSISSGRIYDLEYYANEITVNPFIFEVQAKPNSGAPYVFTLPFIPTSSGGVYDFTVNWGDGSNIETITEIIDGVPKTHTYSTSGGYDVSILGTMEGWTTHGSIVPSGDTMYISELKQWGCFNFNNHFITEMEIGDTGTISLTGSQFVNSAIFENYGTRITATDIPNLSNIESLDISFAGARTSIPNLCLWDLSKIKKMRFTFFMAQGIFAPINNWDISNITDMSGMFFFMSVLRPLNNWDVSNVTNMRYMFCISTLFNQDISMWDVSNVTDMSYMFNCAREFNQPLNNWDVSNVTDMSGMFGNDYFPFYGSGKFNQPLNNWITTSCTNMSQMFYNARYFDQDISMWDVSNVTDMTEMFYGATLSTTNYSNLLNGWSTQEVQPNVVFSGGNSKYNSSAADARNHLITVHGWTITDGGLE